MEFINQYNLGSLESMTYNTKQIFCIFCLVFRKTHLSIHSVAFRLQKYQDLFKSPVSNYLYLSYSDIRFRKISAYTRYLNTYRSEHVRS
jgi:hypothetical protein